MSRPGLDVVLYALIVAASPLALASTLVVLRSGRGRLNGTLFAGGFLLGQTLVYLLAFIVGAASVQERTSGHPTLESLLELALGIALLVVAVRMRRSRQLVPSGAPARPPSPRAEAFMNGLARLKPPTAFGAGSVLGIGGPKRFVIAVIAAAAISTSGLRPEGKLAVSVAYVLIATVLVWLPVTLYVVAGDRAGEWVARARDWLNEYRDPLSFYPVLAFGLVLCGVAIAGLS